MIDPDPVPPVDLDAIKAALDKCFYLSAFEGHFYGRNPIADLQALVAEVEAHRARARAVQQKEQDDQARVGPVGCGARQDLPRPRRRK